MDHHATDAGGLEPPESKFPRLNVPVTDADPRWEIFRQVSPSSSSASRTQEIPITNRSAVRPPEPHLAVARERYLKAQADQLGRSQNLYRSSGCLTISEGRPPGNGGSQDGVVATIGTKEVHPVGTFGLDPRNSPFVPVVAATPQVTTGSGTVNISLDGQNNLLEVQRDAENLALATTLPLPIEDDQ